jgi:thioredoxin-related protein
MAETKSRSTLDMIANIAIILVCIIASVVLVNNFLQNRQAQQAQQAAGPRPPEVKKGEQLAALKGVVPAGANRALVVALQPGCHFCNESMPFYKRLIDERNKQGSDVKVIAAVGREETKAEEQQKMAEAGVQPDGMVTLDFQQAKIAGTPTMLLVDNQGKVLNVWVGKVPEGDEDDVMEALKAS